jgi:catechol 2,3-dioxygenase-like lactoylglutathione lyase family enzyme
MQKTESHSTRKELKPRVVGINHVALEVGDLEEALAFYGRLFSFTLRGRHQGMAFIELGDQFIALVEQRTQPPDRRRHLRSETLCKPLV